MAAPWKPAQQSLLPRLIANYGHVFTVMDRLLDETDTGSRYLSQPEIADMIVEAIHHNATHLRHYDLHAFVVMPNHIHLLVTPAVALPKLTKSLNGITSKRANVLLGLTGKTFWQDESYDRLIRNQSEFNRIVNYIEENPVRAGLVADRSAFRWSSAWATGGSPADQGVRPTTVI